MASTNRINGSLPHGIPATQEDVVEALRGAGAGFRTLVGDAESRLWEQIKTLEERLAKGLVRDPAVMAGLARSVAEALPGEVSDRVAKLEERVARWEEAEHRVRELGTLVSSQQQALVNALNMLEGLRKASEAMLALAGRDQPVPVVNFHPPPPRLLAKDISYDDMGRPIRTVEREVEDQ